MRKHLMSFTSGTDRPHNLSAEWHVVRPGKIKEVHTVLCLLGAAPQGHNPWQLTMDYGEHSRLVWSRFEGRTVFYPSAILRSLYHV